MPDAFHIQPVTDAHDLAELRKVFQQAVEDPDHLRLGWLQERRWAAVPLALDSEPQKQVAGRIARAYGAAGHACLAAVPLEPVQPDPEVLWVPASPEGVAEFMLFRIVLCYLLAPQDLSSVVHFGQEFAVVGGPRSFVEAATGRTVEEVRDTFDAYVHKWEGYNERGHRYYSSLASYYRGIDGEG